ncbi:zinc finger CCHC domain-containing protein 3 [Salmo salar]|uniref:Zinc finger CCHC domain-containing protein 3 n=1 Tax=Salmo salar TaxID=8030 RepID=A0ABM3CDN2_SALSA|nr:zinc finger CCHC domain-containing protein 3-like [Salmo salar]
MSSALVEELRGMVEELAERGSGVSPLPPKPKKKGKRGSSACCEREGGEGGEGVAKRVMGEGRTPLASLFASAPQQLVEGDSQGVALGWVSEGGSQLLLGEVGSPALDLSPAAVGERGEEGVGGEPRMQGTPRPNTIPASWRAFLLEEMEQQKPIRQVPGIGLANTVRFAWTDKETEPWGRDTFGRNILMGYLNLQVKDVLCLQGNPMEKAYDVTFHVEEKHDDIMKKVREGKGARPLCHYEVTSLARNNFRVVTVTMYNPHVKDEEVRAFLGRYVENVSSARHLRDSLGFWNGRRGFQALLREDPKGLGRCMAYGHILASCNTRKCKFCGSGEHEAKDCDEPKACHGCGSSAHLWRECPARQRSYASAAGGRTGDGGKKGK